MTTQQDLKENFRAAGARLRNWGRWGEQDERGTVNPPKASPAGACCWTSQH